MLVAHKLACCVYHHFLMWNTVTMKLACQGESMKDRLWDGSILLLAFIISRIPGSSPFHSPDILSFFDFFPSFP
jgi:hypothetical protein